MNTILLVTKCQKKLFFNKKVMKTFHSVPSVGYCFWQIKSKLKDEYKNLKGPQIGELRKQGVSVLEETHLPLFAFTGDTSIELFRTNEEIFNYPVIITGNHHHGNYLIFNRMHLFV
jgi:hypothetical protein